MRELWALVDAQDPEVITETFGEPKEVYQYHNRALGVLPVTEQQLPQFQQRITDIPTEGPIHGIGLFRTEEQAKEVGKLLGG